MSISLEGERRRVMTEIGLYGLDVIAIFERDGCEGVIKLVDATNRHFLVEAENGIWYDIVRDYGSCRSLFY